MGYTTGTLGALRGRLATCQPNAIINWDDRKSNSSLHPCMHPPGRVPLVSFSRCSRMVEFTLRPYGGGKYAVLIHTLWRNTCGR